MVTLCYTRTLKLRRQTDSEGSATANGALPTQVDPQGFHPICGDDPNGTLRAISQYVRRTPMGPSGPSPNMWGGPQDVGRTGGVGGWCRGGVGWGG